jgi:hypothetical protein
MKLAKGEREPETPLSVPGLQFTDCVNPSPLCEFAFEHQKLGFSLSGDCNPVPHSGDEEKVRYSFSEK